MHIHGSLLLHILQDWDLLNDVKAIWLRSSSDVSDEEYNKFYKTISKVGLHTPCLCYVCL